MELQAHQQRVVEEAAELDQKIERLDGFLKSEKAAMVDAVELHVMRSQLLWMRRYSMCLHERMDLWKLHP